MKQERFLSSGDVKAEDDTAVWFVPLQTVTAGKPKQPAADILQSKSGVFELKDYKKSSDFLKVNFCHTGFYRTKYEDTMYQKLGQAVKAGNLGPSDRVGLLNDIFALSRAGYTSAVNGLTLLENYSNEDNYM